MKNISRESFDKVWNDAVSEAKAFYAAADMVMIPWRCLVTNNPVGTVTENIGHSCQCQVCRLARINDDLRGQLKINLPRGL